MKSFLLSIQVYELSIYTVNHVLYKICDNLEFYLIEAVVELICH